METFLTIQNGIITVSGAIIVATFGIVARNINRDKDEMNKNLAKKADKELMDERFSELNQKINLKADKESVENINSNITYIRKRIDDLIDHHLK